MRKFLPGLVVAVLCGRAAAKEAAGLKGLLEALPPLLREIREHRRQLDQALKPEGGSAAGEGEESTAGPPPGRVQTPVPEIRQDPFQISALMQKRALFLEGGLHFVPSAEDRIPPMRLRGIVDRDLALLEVEGADVYLVRPGDTISLTRRGRNVVIKVEKIDRLSLQVKVGTLQEVVIVR